MLDVFSVVVFHRSMVNWRLALVLMHSAICDQCCCMPYIYGQLEGVHLPLVYVHSAICETYFSVVVFHRSMVNWRRVTLVYMHTAICETSVV